MEPHSLNSQYLPKGLAEPSGGCSSEERTSRPRVLERVLYRRDLDGHLKHLLGRYSRAADDGPPAFGVPRCGPFSPEHPPDGLSAVFR